MRLPASNLTQEMCQNRYMNHRSIVSISTRLVHLIDYFNEVQIYKSVSRE